jgi:hypothetical protein
MHTRCYSGIKSASANLYNSCQQLRACFMTSIGCVDVSDLIYNFFNKILFLCGNYEADSITENLQFQGIAQLRPDFVAPGLSSNEI